jgi:hypothetical protein
VLEVQQATIEGEGRTASWACFEGLSTLGDTALIARAGGHEPSPNFSSIAA